MDETRIDRLETEFAELRAGQRTIENRLCKIEGDLGVIGMRLDQTATKADLHELRTEMYKALAEMKTWMVATLVSVVATVFAAMFGLHHWGG